MVRSGIETPFYKEINHAHVKLIICFDPYNQRVRVDEIIGNLDQAFQIIIEQTPPWVEKIIVKLKEKQKAYFLANGFIEEGHIPRYFAGEDMSFLVKYTTPKRKKYLGEREEQSILHNILSTSRNSPKSTNNYIKIAELSDAAKLAELYNKVFSVYPTPLGEAEYVKNTMRDGTLYVFIEDNDRIVSAASAEINNTYKNAELTDCATLEEAQGKGYNIQLIAKLENLLSKKNMGVCYSLARAKSYAINKIFYNLGYHYTGKLINNCNIYSGLENMNVWYKINPKT
jgi:putative beta-lysine N-acetyltransferase